LCVWIRPPSMPELLLRPLWSEEGALVWEQLLCRPSSLRNQRQTQVTHKAGYADGNGDKLQPAKPHGEYLRHLEYRGKCGVCAAQREADSTQCHSIRAA
jgi:hypothetical protein